MKVVTVSESAASVGYLLSLSSERPRGLWMEMSGEDDGYWADTTAESETWLRFKSDDEHSCHHCAQIHKMTKTKHWMCLSLHPHWGDNRSITCWSRVKVRVSRTNWETESSAVDGYKTRLTSQPLRTQHVKSWVIRYQENKRLHVGTLCQTPFKNMSI